MSANPAISGDAPAFEFNNAFHAFLDGVQKLTGFSQEVIERQTGIDQAILYRLCHNQDSTGITREAAASYTQTLYRLYRRTEGFRVLWKQSKPELDQWADSFRTKKEVTAESARIRRAQHAPKEKDPLNDFVDALLEKRKDLTRAALERISRSDLGNSRSPSYYDHRKRELVRRVIYLLAPVDPATYLDHEERLTRWTGRMDSLFTKNAADSIGLAAAEVLSRSFVEEGLSNRQFAFLSGIPQSTLRRFIAGGSSWPVIEQCSFGFSKAIPRGPWLELATPYADDVELRYVQDRGRLKEQERDTVSAFVEALDQRIHDDLRRAALGVMRRAVRLKPDRLAARAKGEWRENWRPFLESRIDKPVQLDLNHYRIALEVVQREFEGDRQPVLLPAHLHNKPGSDLQAAEVAPQIDWLNSLIGRMSLRL